MAAVDLFGSGARGMGRDLLAEVQCRQEPASITFDWIRLADEPPPGATVFGTAKPAPETTLRPGAMAGVRAQPDWLANDSPEFAATAENGALRLHVTVPGKGMKWSLPLPEPLDLEPYRYAAIRYRAQGMRRHGDYAIWLADQAGGRAAQSCTLLHPRDMVADGQWRVLTRSPWPKRFRLVEMALQNVSEGPAADLWLDEIRFSGRRPRFPVAKLCPVETLAAVPAGFAPVPLSGETVPGLRRAPVYGLADWFADGLQSVHGTPFAIAEGRARELAGEGTLELPVGRAASELHVLMATAPPEMNYARMSKGAPMTAFSNPERFVFAVVYEDGLRDEIFPLAKSTNAHEVRRGLDVYVLAGLREVPIRRIEAVSRMESARAFWWGGSPPLRAGPWRRRCWPCRRPRNPCRKIRARVRSRRWRVASCSRTTCSS